MCVLALEVGGRSLFELGSGLQPHEPGWDVGNSSEPEDIAD